MCSAETRCEISRMRRRCPRQRSRAAAMSKLMRPPEQRGALLDDGPVVRAGVTGLAEQLAPAGRVIVSLGREHPAQEQLPLVVIAVRVDLDVAAPRSQALDLAHRLHARLALQVVDGVEA